MINYKDGMTLELWVWDKGELEGFSIYMDGQQLDHQDVLAMRYPIAPPETQVEVLVKFGGKDGGATKIVDMTDGKKVVLAHNESGLDHRFVIGR
jgi:hypothetical protein